jgi:hypothetical protein
MCILFKNDTTRPEKTKFVFKELGNAGFEQTQGRVDYGWRQHRDYDCWYQAQ